MELKRLTAEGGLVQGVAIARGEGRADEGDGGVQGPPRPHPGQTVGALLAKLDRLKRSRVGRARSCLNRPVTSNGDARMQGAEGSGAQEALQAVGGVARAMDASEGKGLQASSSGFLQGLSAPFARSGTAPALSLLAESALRTTSVWH